MEFGTISLQCDKAQACTWVAGCLTPQDWLEPFDIDTPPLPQIA